MPPINLNAFHAAVQTMRDGDVVVLNTAKGQQEPALKGIRPFKAKKVDGLEMRQAFYSALVKGGGDEACLKSIWKKLGLDNPKMAHKPLTARDVKATLDERTQSQLMQFAVDNKDPMPCRSFDGFEIVEKPPEKKPGDDFVVVERMHTQTDFLESTDADKVRDANLQERRDMLCTHLKAQTAVTDAQLQRLDVEGMKALSAWAKFAPEAARNPGRLQEMVEALSISFEKVNQDVVLTSVSRLETDPVFAQKAEIAPEAKQTSKANATQNFLADLVLDSDSTQHDNLSPEARILSVIAKNAKAVKGLMTQPYGTNAMNVPPLQASMIRHVTQQLCKLFGYEEKDFENPFKLTENPKEYLKKAAECLKNIGGLEGRINDKMAEFKAKLDRGEPVPELAAFDKSIQDFVDDRSEKLQNVMAETFECMMSNKSCEMGKLLSEVDPDSKEMLDGMNPLKKDEPVADEEDVDGEKDELPDHLNKDFKEPVMSENEMRECLGKTGMVDGKSKPYAEMTPEEWERATENLTAAERRDATFAVWVKKYPTNDVLGAVMARLKDDVETEAAFSIAESYAGYADLAKELARDNIKAKLEPLSTIDTMTLDEIVSKGALDPRQGYGKFIVNSMKIYFKSVDAIDKRAMYAALIRNAPTTAELLNQPQDDAPGKDDEFMGATLGAYFKGAGPVMQKTLQLLSSMDLPKAFKAALVDMRSNLLPLPDKIVQAMLAKLVEDSHGEITHIVAKKTLGAASVAQSILCEITGKDGVRREVVVKLVRPDAAYRADREKRVFLEAAGEDEGMRSSFLGRLERIMEEFDLEIEAANAELGKVYDKSGKLYEHSNSLIISDQSEKFSDVKAVKIDGANPKGSHFAVIMEKAPGTTLDRKIESAAETIKKSTDAFHKLKTVEEKKNYLLENGDRLLTLNKELMSAKNKMVHFAHQWVNEALYEGGFFHGDAHAGNLMVSENSLTAIDFGNATKLTPHDQKMVLRVIGSCQSRDVDMFVQSFREMLSEAGKRSFDSQEEAVKNRVQLLMNKMTSNGQVGTLIMATLIELQKMEIEIPAPIFNFSQCQMLIQGTIEQLDAQLTTLHTHLYALAQGTSSSGNGSGIQYLSNESLNAKYEEVRKALNGAGGKYEIGLDGDLMGYVIRVLNAEDNDDDLVNMDFDSFENGMRKLTVGEKVGNLHKALVESAPYQHKRLAKKQAALISLRDLIGEINALRQSKNENLTPREAILADVCKGFEGQDLTDRNVLAGVRTAIDLINKKLVAETNAVVGASNLSGEEKLQRSQDIANRMEPVDELLRQLDMLKVLSDDVQHIDEKAVENCQKQMDELKVAGDADKAFVNAMRDFQSKFLEARAEDLKNRLTDISAEKDRRKKVPLPNAGGQKGEKTEDEKLREKITAVVHPDEWDKKTTWQNERSFLSVMAGDLAEHKLKTATSLGFQGSIKFISKLM